ncbi:PDZ domain-containing protein [Rhodopirellula europaea]|uniref:PDZ domain-containing protein n=1 Tax=Rhodopirellula europaea TaxID=1263866 RepID=UPI003D2B2EB4
MTQSHFTPHFRPSKLAVASAVLLALAVSSPASSQQPSAGQENGQKKAAQAESSGAKSSSGNKNQAHQNEADHSEHAQQESPALGVVVGSCPGKGVCVEDTVWGSPAGEAGIRQGDYILSVDGQQVSSPQQLTDAVKKMKAGKQVSVKFWREGQEMSEQLTLASQAEQPPESHKAWLGVMLAPADEEGVSIEQVMSDSPASEAGLQVGDTITKQGGKEVSDMQSFMESVEDSGPGSELKLTIKRNGKEQQMPVKLGHVHQAPMRFLRHIHILTYPNDSQSASGQSGSGGESSLTDDTLDEMRRQIRELQQQISELKGQQGGRQAQGTDSDDLSMKVPSMGSNGTMLVVQRGGHQGTYNRGYSNRGYNWNRNQNWNNYNNNDWRNRYQSQYRSPLYRSPQYGNSYYRYGGQPYYGNFGRGYGSGYNRPGIQLGNFGVYWY